MKGNNEIIYCPRCGAEMKASSRYCMKCGCLNYDHPENANMRQYIGNNNTESYVVGSGQSILGNVSNGAVTQGIANNTGNKLLCFCLNYFIYLFFVGGCLLLTLISVNFDVMKVLDSIFPYFAVIFSIVFFYCYSMQLIYMKANQRWWSSFVPIYSQMKLSEIVFNNELLGLCTFIPLVGSIFALVMNYKLAEKFGYNGWLMLFFPEIIIPLIAFGSSSYDGRTFVDPDVKNSTEKEYGRKKIFLITCFLFFAVGVACIIYSNMSSVEKASGDIEKSYYKKATDKVIRGTKAHIAAGDISCDGDYNSMNGVYYFYYGDVGSDFNLPLSITREAIEAYVKVVNVNGVSSYYISMTDGKYGYPETLSDKVSIDTITKYKTLNYSSSDGMNCSLMTKSS